MGMPIHKYFFFVYHSYNGHRNTEHHPFRDVQRPRKLANCHSNAHEKKSKERRIKSNYYNLNGNSSVFIQAYVFVMATVHGRHSFLRKDGQLKSIIVFVIAWNFWEVKFCFCLTETEYVFLCGASALFFFLFVKVICEKLVQ